MSCSLVSKDFEKSFLATTSHEIVAQNSADFPIF